MIRSLFSSLERLIRRSSKISTDPIIERNAFSWVKELESCYPQIRAELDNVLSNSIEAPNFQDISAQQRGLTRDSGWKVFVFWCYGSKSDVSCRLCPRTAEAIRRIPGMKTAFFSILAPGKRIPVHRGPYNGVVRCHLALKIPQNSSAVRLQVAGVEYAWTEGKCLLFDDTYLHAAWNLSDETRVVLFLDIERPCRWPISWLNRTILYLIMWSPFVRDARANYDRWEKKFEGRRP